MYKTLITTPDVALCHLFIHCCFKDGEFKQAEIDLAADKFVSLALHKELNFKNEIQNYKLYRDKITDEVKYLEYLIKLINPTNEAALFSHCLELCLSDSQLDASENKLFETLGTVLQLPEQEQNAIKKLMVQRQVVKTNKFF
ncbi:MAG TPA: TerB family tellurite resistance protein [Chitinophagaceae bacterium]